MSEGYMINGKTILCCKEDAEKYTSLEAINNPEVRVMVNPGSLNEKFACENLKDVTLIIHDVNQEIPSLIATGEADIMITEVAEAGYYVRKDARLAAPLYLEPFTDGQIGIFMPKGSEDLLNYFPYKYEDMSYSDETSLLDKDKVTILGKLVSNPKHILIISDEHTFANEEQLKAISRYSELAPDKKIYILGLGDLFQSGVQNTSDITDTYFQSSVRLTNTFRAERQGKVYNERLLRDILKEPMQN